MCPDVLTEKKTTFIPIPYGPSRKTPLTVVYTVGYVLFKDSHHKAEAAEVLKFLTKGEAIKEWPMNLCPKKGVTLDERVAALPFGEAVRWFEKEMREIVNATETRSWDSTAPAEETYRIFNKNFVELYKKKVTPEEMYRNLRAEIVPLQEELK
jgi:ABC-type glycerol-3-phosphate transport system substrate-binding protein